MFFCILAVPREHIVSSVKSYGSHNDFFELHDFAVSLTEAGTVPAEMARDTSPVQWRYLELMGE